LVELGALIVVVFQAFLQQISIGDTILYITALGTVENALKMGVLELNQIRENILFFTYYTRLIALPTKMSDRSGVQLVQPLRSKIEFCNVSFRYSDRHSWVLRNINLVLAEGSCTALVGLNGAGKTTLVKLLTRLYEPTEGHILWDGTDIREFDVAELRRHIGALFQDFARYDLTVRENIGFGRIEAVDDIVHIQEAAANAGVAGFVNELPNDYQTTLSRWLLEPGEVGMDLSGGQWQKIAMARLYMTFPETDVLILDEPTSALDAEAEYEVFKHFTDLSMGRTTLLISHRFSTVRLADRIAVLENNTIAEYGSHEELLALDGTYARLYNLQAKQYVDDREAEDNVCA
jgi:ATP-binding cassette subfamily B protein